MSSKRRRLAKLKRMAEHPTSNPHEAERAREIIASMGESEQECDLVQVSAVEFVEERNGIKYYRQSDAVSQSMSRAYSMPGVYYPPREISRRR